MTWFYYYEKEQFFLANRNIVLHCIVGSSIKQVFQYADKSSSSLFFLFFSVALKCQEQTLAVWVQIICPTTWMDPLLEYWLCLWKSTEIKISLFVKFIITIAHLPNTGYMARCIVGENECLEKYPFKSSSLLGGWGCLSRGGICDNRNRDNLGASHLRGFVFASFVLLSFFILFPFYFTFMYYNDPL